MEGRGRRKASGVGGVNNRAANGVNGRRWRGDEQRDGSGGGREMKAATMASLFAHQTPRAKRAALVNNISGKTMVAWRQTPVSREICRRNAGTWATMNGGV